MLCTGPVLFRHCLELFALSVLHFYAKRSMGMLDFEFYLPAPADEGRQLGQPAEAGSRQERRQECCSEATPC